MLFTTSPDKGEKSFLEDSIMEIAIRYRDWYMRHPGESLYNKDAVPWTKKTEEELWKMFLEYDKKRSSSG